MALEHTVRVYPSRRELARAAAHLFVSTAREAVRLRGRFMVALAGGSTPRDLYQLLGDDGDLWKAIPWSYAHVFWGDERHVPPSHDDSNFRVAREALLDHVPIPADQIYRIEAEDPDAERAALAYERTLRTAFGLGAGDWPSFDLVLLGMGDDGHTASLFPGNRAVHERARLVVAPFVEKLGAHRITMTPPVLLRARATAVLVAGAGKADTLRDVLEGPFDLERYPVQCLRDSTGSTTWLVDASAASKLTPGAAHP